MPKKPEEITVIGGGYTGAISAVILAQQKDCEENPLYKVTLLEKNKNLFHGASTCPGRLHLGGEYPKDEQTALECLEGAIAFKQMFGEKVLTDIPEVRYLVSQESQENSDLTLEEVISSYSNIKNKYTEYFNQAVEELLQENHNLSRYKAGSIIANRLFGFTDDFYSVLPADKIDSDHWYGGISTNERGLDPIALGVHLTRLLDESGVKVRTNYNVLDINKGDKNFTINIENEQGGKENIQSSQIVNAAWEGSYSLNKDISTQNNQPDQNVHLRAISMVDLSECQTPPNHASFGLIGKSGGMFSPFNDKYALFYSPEAAYLDSTKLDGSNTKIPQNWNNYQADEKLIESYQKALDKRYPNVKGAKIIDILVRPTIAFAKELEQRRHCEVEETEEGFHTAISTKATFTVTSALQVLNSVMQRSGHTIDKSEKSVLLPKHLRNLTNVEISDLEAKSFAKERGLPVGITSQNFKNNENSKENSSANGNCDQSHNIQKTDLSGNDNKTNALLYSAADIDDALLDSSGNLDPLEENKGKNWTNNLHRQAKLSGQAR